MYLVTIEKTHLLAKNRINSCYGVRISKWRRALPSWEVSVSDDGEDVHGRSLLGYGKLRTCRWAPTFFNTEDEVSMLVRIVGTYLEVYTASKPRRPLLGRKTVSEKWSRKVNITTRSWTLQGHALRFTCTGRSSWHLGEGKGERVEGNACSAPMLRRPLARGTACCQ